MEKSTSTAQLAVTPPLAPIGASGNGSALFVINLCASIAPVRLDGNNIPGLENYRLYQVARNEDGRTRHRLRLGFFTSESHAESVLTVVRQQYPTAFTACLCDEDRRFTRGYLPETAAAPARPVAAVPTPAPVVQSRPAAAATKPAAKPSAAAEPEVIELTWEPETAPAAKSGAAPTEGFDEFTWEPPSLTPAADAAIAKTVNTGILKAPALKAPDKGTSDTARHPALKLAPKAAAAPAKAPVAAKPLAAKPAIPVVAKAPTPAATTKPAAKPAAPIAASKQDTASSMRVRALALTISDPPPAAVQAQRTAPAAPFHVGKGVEIKDVGISLAAEAAAKPAAPAAKTDKAPVVAKPIAKPIAKPATKLPEKVTKVAAKPAHTPAAPFVTAKPATHATSAPELDSTQTIRALTNAEMEDAAQEKWFAVQLAVSDQPVNLDAMPRLDIFEAYRLYSVASAGSGKIVHSLRLGFFKEAVSAEAVMGYLQTFFGTPSVMRISVAEHARFKDAPVAKKAAAPVHEAKVVELNNARGARPVIPTVTMEVASGIDPAATGAFKSLDTGSFNTGSFNTGSFKTSATGRHKALKSAKAKTGNTGKHKTLPAVEKRSLSEQLLDEAREVELSASGIRKLPKNDSLISRMFGKLTK